MIETESLQEQSFKELKNSAELMIEWSSMDKIEDIVIERGRVKNQRILSLEWIANSE